LLIVTLTASILFNGSTQNVVCGMLCSLYNTGPTLFPNISGVSFLTATIHHLASLAFNRKKDEKYGRSNMEWCDNDTTVYAIYSSILTITTYSGASKVTHFRKFLLGDATKCQKIGLLAITHASVSTDWDPAERRHLEGCHWRHKRNVRGGQAPLHLYK